VIFSGLAEIDGTLPSENPVRSVSVSEILIDARVEEFRKIAREYRSMLRRARNQKAAVGNQISFADVPTGF